MTREEAIKRIDEQYKICKEFYYLSANPEKDYPGVMSYMKALGMAITALRGPTREMVERMRGCSDCQRKTCVSCRRFGRVPERCVDCNNQDKWSPWNFCPVCGKPMSDEAVEMVIERLEELHENIYNS